MGVLGVVIACLLVGGGIMIYRPELIGLHPISQAAQSVSSPVAPAAPIKQEQAQQVTPPQDEESDYSDGNEETRRGRVLGQGVRVRQSPSKDGMIIAQKGTSPARGSHVVILQKQNAWYLIQYNSHGRTVKGWTYAGLIDSENPGDYGVIKINGEWRAYDRQTNTVIDPLGQQYPLQTD